MVCLSVGRPITIVSPAKTAEPIEMSFGKWTRVGPMNYVLYGGSDSLCECAILRGERGAPL